MRRPLCTIESIDNALIVCFNDAPEGTSSLTDVFGQHDLQPCDERTMVLDLASLSSIDFGLVAMIDDLVKTRSHNGTATAKATVICCNGGSVDPCLRHYGLGPWIAKPASPLSL